MDTDKQPNYAEKRVKKPVVSGDVHVREKSIFDDVREFFGLKKCDTFRDYVGTLSDMTNRVYGAIDTLMGGRGVDAGRSGVNGGRPPYAQLSTGGAATNNEAASPRRIAASYSYEDIEFNLRADAEKVLFDMQDMLAVYSSVTVNDLFDLAGITSPNGYNDCKYGWKDLSSARVVPVGRKFKIVGLPTPVRV